MCDHKDCQDISQLLEQNRLWADQMVESDPDFFNRLSDQQNPDFLWIGCSDSRVPANQIINLPPGEVFVHRNVANVLHHNDMNALSVIQYAVDVLKVKHIMIVGHYGCGGVRAAVTGGDNGIVDYWLNTVRNLYHQHQESLADLSLDEQVDRMCELNVRAQVSNLCQTKILQRAWERNQEVKVHGWCYSLKNGLVNDLSCTVTTSDEAEAFRLSC
ncbi:carbonate dehydratase [Kushneria marisflavi]|uniref:Carbonic anhydrase n=1 Tax=Kushneria marisflavi TaxID=157779 RepID=A0A240UKY3_9GAMM|nr:carbonate dehydratase [Kushneria marisflavi]ART61680.1 carbonate dehydratase [Kushneria marisflavi]RKD86695.1 carbonic anhydrase [Kushneria marisflavi]